MKKIFISKCPKIRKHKSIVYRNVETFFSLLNLMFLRLNGLRMREIFSFHAKLLERLNRFYKCLRVRLSKLYLVTVQLWSFLRVDTVHWTAGESIVCYADISKWQLLCVVTFLLDIPTDGSPHLTISFCSIYSLPIVRHRRLWCLIMVK